MSGLKRIFHWKAQVLIFSRSSLKLILDWVIPYTAKKTEVSLPDSLRFELKLFDKSLI